MLVASIQMNSVPLLLHPESPEACCLLHICVRSNCTNYELQVSPVEGVVEQVPGSLLGRSDLAAQGQAFCVQDPGFFTWGAQKPQAYYIIGSELTHGPR